MPHLAKLRRLGNCYIISLPKSLTRELHWPCGTWLQITRKTDQTLTLETLEDWLRDHPRRTPGNPR